MDPEFRSAVRWLWLAVQDHRCGVCGVGVAGRYGRQARWVLDYVRAHDGAVCPPGGECPGCVQGTTCRVCMLHLTHFRRGSGYVPRKPVNGLQPAAWAARAAAYASADFRSLCGSGAVEAPHDGGDAR